MIRTRLEESVSDTLISRPPEKDLEAEQNVLGALMVDNQAIDLVAEYLKPGDFHEPAHALIYATILDLYQRREPVEPPTVVADLRRRQELDKVGGPTAITDLYGLVATAANAEFYAHRVVKISQSRNAALALASSLQDLTHSRDRIEERLDRVQKTVLQATEPRLYSKATDIGEVLKQVFDAIDQRRQGKTTGIPSGFASLDQLTNGFQKQELTVIAARPGAGKSTFAMNVVKNICDPRTHNKAAVFFALEMQPSEITTNLLCSLARVNVREVRSQSFSVADEQRLLDWSDHVNRMKFLPIGCTYLTVTECRARARRLKAEGKCDAVFVDYLQLMSSPTDRRGRPRHEEVSEISRGLKALAVELDIPVIAMAQLNRNSEERGGRPRLSDLRESGSIEQDSALVIILHRPELSMTREQAEAEGVVGKASVLIAKNRFGPTGELNFRFDGSTATFSEDF